MFFLPKTFFSRERVGQSCESPLRIFPMQFVARSLFLRKGGGTWTESRAEIWSHIRTPRPPRAPAWSGAGFFTYPGYPGIFFTLTKKSWVLGPTAGPPPRLGAEKPGWVDVLWDPPPGP